MLNGTGQPNGHHSDFLAEFLDLTEAATSPLIYRTWSAIASVAVALERRVWSVVGERMTYPNLYVLLVGPPGAGKYIVEETRQLWRQVRDQSGAPLFHIARDSVTRAALVDGLGRARRDFLPREGDMMTYHSLAIGAEEFSVLLPSYDLEFISRLNYLFNNPPILEEERRSGLVKEVIIPSPQLNILAGVQPSYFVSTFPEEAWTTGLARRILMIYALEPPIYSLLREVPSKTAVRQRVIARLGELGQACGQFRWRREAVEELDQWYTSGQKPKPTHSKMLHYNQSRIMFLIKLAMISSAMRGIELVVEPLDVRRAFAWLFEAEKLMPDIFRDMAGRSDKQVLEELHYFVMAEYSRNKNKPLHTSQLLSFLADRAPGEKVDKLLDLAERTNMLARNAGAGDSWTPRPKHLHGVE